MAKSAVSTAENGALIAFRSARDRVRGRIAVPSEKRPVRDAARRFQPKS